MQIKGICFTTYLFGISCLRQDINIKLTFKNLYSVSLAVMFPLCRSESIYLWSSR